VEMGLLIHHSFEWYYRVVNGLTAIQRRVLEALRRRVDQGEPVATYRELCAEFGWASTGTIRDHLRALVRKGYVELTGKHRQIRLRDEHAAIARIPLIGRVVAGVPVISEENIEQRIPVPAAWTRRGTFFALRVAGDSMRDAGILEGDQVVVRQQSVAADRDVVVATIEGETTIKRLRLRGRRVTLVAENPRYRPIEVRAEQTIIQGVVVGLMRECSGAAVRSAH
jgi:repressor LexA